VGHQERRAGEGHRLTLHSACKITGLEIRTEPKSGSTFKALAYDGETLVSTATERTLSRAIEVLVNSVYKIRSEQVRREQRRRCFSCLRLVPLEIDHIRARGSLHGRDDRRYNLRALCTDCHGRRHHPLHPAAPEIHPEIKIMMLALGWAWAGEEEGWERIMPSYDITQESDRWQFEVERLVIGRTVEGVTVTSEYVQVDLSGNSAIRFRVDGENITVTLPGDPPRPTLDMEPGGLTQ